MKFYSNLQSGENKVVTLQHKGRHQEQSQDFNNGFYRLELPIPQKFAFTAITENRSMILCMLP
jgi:hypothetical protein